MNPGLLLAADFLRELAIDFLIVLYYAGFGTLILETRPRWKTVLECFGIHAAVHIIFRYLLSSFPVSFLLLAGDLICVSRLLWRPARGVRFWGSFLICMPAETIFCEILSTNLFVRLYPNPGMTVTLSWLNVYILLPYSYPTFFGLLIASMAMLLGVMYSLKTVIHKLRTNSISLSRIACLLLFFGLLLFMLILLGYYYNQQIFSNFSLHSFAEMLPTTLFCSLGTILLILYVWQDFQRILLRQENNSLLEKNTAYQRVIDGNREYRHNISNMLYGLEGMIMTGNISQIEAFYTDMVRRCAELNNESVVAINRIKDPALAALLLHKMNRAAEMHVPFRIASTVDFRFIELSPVAQCEILGNLIDNALEAAEKSESPIVNLVMQRTNDYREILLSNTYAEHADLSFLTAPPVSSKANHTAAGLDSVRKKLRHCHHTCLNLYKQGRYIEASLCEYDDL